MRKYILLLISLIVISCEDAYDKEERYQTDLNAKFYSSFPNELREIFLSKNKSKRKCTLNIDFRKKICPIEKGMDENYNRTIEIDHRISKELISNGFNISYDINEIEYLIFTENDFEKVGVYIDDNGKKKDDASIVYNSLYIYDLKANKLCFITSHKGSEPKETIYRGTNRYDLPIGRGWYAEDYLEYLIENRYLIKDNSVQKIKGFYAEEYVEFLEKNNFYGIEIDK